MDKKISQLTSATIPLAGTEVLPMVQGGATVKALQADLFQWPTGRVTYVPIGGDIQAAVTAATAGDTLILGAGSYPITATITVDKAILIKGQGLSATKVTTATPNLAVFTLTASTARVTDLYIGNTGTGTSYAIYAGDGLTQLQISNVIAVLGGNGLKYGVWSQSSVTVSNSEMYITSADQNSNGVVIYNDSAATVNISANVQNVRVLATGATLNNRGVVFNNNNTAKTITGNVTNCNLTAYASSGATDIALYIQSTTTFNSTVNAYDSVLSGADSDVTVTGTNSCTLTNCTLVNGMTTGTITYGGTQVVSKLNGNTITKGTGVLTLAADKTFTASNSVTLTATDGSTLAIGAGGTLGTAAYTASTAYAPAAGSSSIVTTGALTSGSIAAGFGTIVTGGVIESTGVDGIYQQSTVGSVKVVSIGNQVSFPISNGKTMTFSPTYGKLFIITIGATGEAGLFWANYSSATITSLGTLPTSIELSATPATGHIGLTKSANANAISVVAGATAGTALTNMTICVIGANQAYNPPTDWV